MNKEKVMPNYKAQAQLFKILMHPTRLSILDVLRGGEQCVCHMEAVLGLRQAHISQHLMVLREAGLVTDRRDGWNIFYRVCKPEIYQVIEAMDAFMGAADSAPPRKSPAVKKQHACPCPKCNPGKETIKLESPDLARDRIKATI
jgi:DNA-binding transcriptional ArsR family regulator